MNEENMKIIDTFYRLNECFSDGTFNKQKWVLYLDSIYMGLSRVILNDITAYDFDKDCSSIIEDVMIKWDKTVLCHNSFIEVTNSLENKIMNIFNKTMDVDIVLYISGCNAAGHATKINGRNTILLGIEKILELHWEALTDMYGLVYHELGHIYQAIYGVLDRIFNCNKDTFLWTLFTEGVAMHFEQILIGDYDFFHQDKNNWKKWNQDNFTLNLSDFYLRWKNDIECSDFFGDWVLHNGQPDVGYYLGAGFVNWICKYNEFDEVIAYSIEKVSVLFENYMLEQA